MDLLFSDIHADKKAAWDLEDMAGRFDILYCCGDICGYRKDFEYVIDTLMNLNVKAVRGNHDHMVIDPTFDLDYLPSRVSDPIRWTRERIKDKHLEYLYNLPDELEYRGVYLTHTSDFDFYVTDREHCSALLDQTERSIIGIGHTHVPLMFDFGERKVINPGSITFGRKGFRRGYVTLDEDEIVFETLE